MQRRSTRKVAVGNLFIGGDAPISVQSMTKTFTSDVEATNRQIAELAGLGCHIIRCAVPTMKEAKRLGDIRKGSPIPVIADIHFGYDTAMESIRQGVDGIRINPGNMPSGKRLERLAKTAADSGIKIRVGVNSGSVASRLQENDLPLTEAALCRLMVDKTLEFCEKLETFGFGNIVISMKASDVATTMEACREAAMRCDYPLHLGVTAAGPPSESLVKSAIGIGGLLSEGIGDTIRVSMTGSPHEEVRAGYEILEALGLAERRSAEILSCPTCGRCMIDLPALVEKVKSKLPPGRKGLKIAIMGCVVNGPGEAKEADFGIAGGRNFGYIFKKGEKLRRVSEERLAEELLKEIDGI
ncbi:MAG TPA: flavodoxin-dependent (E)-4-hydroxy-3-methylbut-2-enyl-diphosphate synthase [Candidatus Brocadiia bacterium]|nr:flavodoxin-dependent (E)-4-hydroxy-3-methylbut-2-enyl-diphosphate synthase [Candidatus Brocadiia bacterium]